MEFVYEEGKQKIHQAPTLIMPALSTGNVGQLAIDLLVSTMNAERIGYLDDPFVLPCVGNDAYGSTPTGVLALPLEAYVSPHNSLTLIQQRSPVIKGMMIEFAKHVAEFAATNGREHVIVLSSLSSGRNPKVDDLRETYYISSSTDDGRDDHCEKLGWKRLPEYNPGQRHWLYLHALAEGNNLLEESPFSEDEISDEAYYPSLPFAALFSHCKLMTYDILRVWNSLNNSIGNQQPVGSSGKGLVPLKRGLEFESRGHAKNVSVISVWFVNCIVSHDEEEIVLTKLLSIWHQAKGLKVTCILCYCSEGDNAQDSFQLAEDACKLLGLDPNNLHGRSNGRQLAHNLSSLLAALMAPSLYFIKT
ncbi:hypothetical protein Sjap_016807 [Stephania japonica]|uniref:Proteasome assembly chaperone 2 n=1 Tax=Stephania japonica TaxID=461633 RepID=A0AAP0I4Z0_9MAGN